LICNLLYAGGASMQWVEAMAQQNIAVVGHVGLIPYISTSAVQQTLAL
jgi:ketopantoate hydroxymethyltransferase